MSALETPLRTNRLRCLACGNDYRFEQIVSFAVNYVTNEGHVVREMASEISAYRCAKCGEPVETPPGWVVMPDDAT